MLSRRVIAVLAGLLILCTVVCTSALAADRCAEYVQEVRAQHARYFGLEFPYWYGVGQLRQESRCRTNLTAFDGGMGIAQFMPATARQVNAELGMRLDPYRPEDGIRMQAYYMARLHRQNPAGALWATYQAYNGGWGNLRSEAARAGSWNRYRMYEQCRRKVLQLKSGALLDLCEVNYDYAIRIYQFAAPYRLGADKMRYW